MILSNPLLLNCPGCSAPHTCINMLSGNTFGGIFWSDGCYLAPMLPDVPRFTKCYVCGLIFNQQNCPKTESESEETDSYPEITTLDKEELIAALGSNAYKGIKEDEIYLRIRLWWAMNPRPFHANETKALTVDAAYRENALALLNLLDDQEEDELITKAELNRNLGQFDECLRYISKVKDKYNEKRVKQIKAAALSGQNSVIRFD
ncbi:MAG: hypothetical protein HGA37_13795 [Lentimicrobium sp.]|nr:hypothetical protein [Lentimicrobium sp.]